MRYMCTYREVSSGVMKGMKISEWQIHIYTVTRLHLHISINGRK